MTYTSPDLADLRATFDLMARPRHRDLTDPHDGNDQPGAPAIRLIDYMGDMDDYYMVNLIGPFPDTAARDRELTRLRALPLGEPQFRGGYEFVPATMARAVRSLMDGRTVAPTRVAAATSIAGFYAAFHGWPDDGDDGPAEMPGQLTLDGAEVTA